MPIRHRYKYNDQARSEQLESLFQRVRPTSGRLCDPIALKLEAEVEDARVLAVQQEQWDAASHATLAKARFIRVHLPRPYDLPPLAPPSKELKELARRVEAVMPAVRASLGRR